jgi:hypothetical protein
MDLYIKTIIFLFYIYIHVFNSSQNDWTFWYKSVISSVEVHAGADPGGGGHPAPPPKIGKNMILWRKIVISHTKYPKNVRASLRN